MSLGNFAEVRPVVEQRCWWTPPWWRRRGVVVGSVRRRGKLLMPGATLAALPSAVVLEGLGLA